MAETISMPKLGFDMAEGTLVRWVKNEGENVNKGDVLAEIETDKATVEVESSASGVVRKLLVEAGSVVPVGDPIAVVGSADEKIEETPAKVAEPKAEKKTDEQGGEEFLGDPSCNFLACLPFNKLKGRSVTAYITLENGKVIPKENINIPATYNPSDRIISFNHLH